MLGIIALVTIIVCVQANPEVELDQGLNKTIFINISERIARDGYYSESHHVVTSDGYILEINRIPYSLDESKNLLSNISKPVVFMMHGLQSSAISFIALGPKLSMAYNLAENGFDVWMGNTRGVLNSRNHLYLNPDNPKDTKAFFDYSFEDIGTKDLPAMIDYVLAYTKRPQLHYIGHSQGGTTFMVLTSTYPEYNQKISSAHLLAAVGYQNSFPSRLLKRAAERTDLLYKLAVGLGFIEILGPNSIEVQDENCNEQSTNVECDFQEIKALVGDIMRLHDSTGGASIKQYAHYGQNIKDRQFRRWDYGLIQNIIKYGRISPPSFNLRRITADITMHYALSDILLSERDVLTMAFVIPNAKARRVRRRSFRHTDFVIARDSKELVTDYIIEQLKKYER